MKRLPDLYFLGPERTGTTWVHQYLASRGDVCLPVTTKETFFFDCHFEQGVDWYLSHFSEANGRRLVVEVAPTYFHSPDAAHRIRELTPDAHVVCTLRDPVKRSYSHYQHMRAYGTTNGTLREAVRDHPQILDASRYAKHVHRLREVFGSERVHLLLLDDLAADSIGFAEQLCAEIGLPPMPPTGEIGQQRVNATGTPKNPRLARIGFLIRAPLRRARLFGLIALARKLGIHRWFFGVHAGDGKASPEDMEFLRRELASEVCGVEAMIGRDLPAWHKSLNAT